MKVLALIMVCSVLGVIAAPAKPTITLSGGSGTWTDPLQEAPNNKITVNSIGADWTCWTSTSAPDPTTSDSGSGGSDSSSGGSDATAAGLNAGSTAGSDSASGSGSTPPTGPAECGTTAYSCKNGYMLALNYPMSLVSDLTFNLVGCTIAEQSTTLEQTVYLACSGYRCDGCSKEATCDDAPGCDWVVSATQAGMCANGVASMAPSTWIAFIAVAVGFYLRD